ncbi:MAG TPA: hypothetical protein VFV50_15000 [Bdellovibrionales bacterium]|nr:hypothetical protein [Bdellovibrionales bacterium]
MKMTSDTRQRFMLLTGFLLICVGMAMILLVLFTPVAYAADDVYNFYFQKAENPQARPAPAPSKVSVESPGDSQDSSRFWELHAGLAYLSDISGSYRGVSFGGQYNVNKYLGVVGHLVYAPNPGSAYTSQAAPAHAWDLNASVVVTPFHIDVVGYNLMQIYVLGGTSTLRSTDEAGSRRVFKFSAGLGFDINFSRTIGFYARMISAPDDRYYGSTGQLGLLYRL